MVTMVRMIAVNRGRNLPELVATSLRDAIADGSLPSSGKLPSEPALAAMLGVSRATLREAITLLEAEGLVDRRHGSGTYLLPSAGLKNNMNVNFGITDVIESAGRAPRLGQRRRTAGPRARPGAPGAWPAAGRACHHAGPDPHRRRQAGR